MGDKLSMRDHRMPAFRTIALVVIAAWGTAGHAAGLGPIRVQSALGQSLHASVPVIGVDASELTASCIKVVLEHPDGATVMPVRAAVGRSGDAVAIQLSTRQAVNEPAVTLNLQVACGTSIQRSYQLLLDPILVLPHLNQAEQQARSSAVNEKNRLREQSMVAPAEEGNVAPSPARRAARKAQAEENSPAAASNPPTRNVAKPAAQQEARKVTRSVLKLSGDDVAIDIGATFSRSLKLSDTLSESRDTGDAQSAAELKKAYDRFAAIMRDEDPAQNGEKQLREMQAKLQELEKQTASLKEKGEQQRQASQAALESAKRDAEPSGWVIALGGLLIAALGAIGWLYRRIQTIGRQHSAELWEKTVLGQPSESTEWENTFGADDTFAAIDASTGVLTEAKPSDWERGVPLDDTLAVDWASQQATMQAATPRASSPHKADSRVTRHHPEPTFGDEAKAEAKPAAQGAGHGSQGARPEVSTAAPSGKTISKQNSGKVAATGAAAATTAADTARQLGAKSDADAHSMEVEEISDLMQEAEFWMLLNDPERAIDMLEPCLQIERPVSPVPWIYLLDLYRVTERKDNYRTLAARIKKVFNTNAPAWDEQESEMPMHSLRDYPHVIQKIEELWEGDDIIPYLESLLLDDREGERAGFGLAVYREIVHLIGVARDPKTLRWRGQLNFDNPQACLISQKVSMPAAGSGKVAEPAISEEESDIFDRATSQQAVARQVTMKAAVPKATSAEMPAAKPPVSANTSKAIAEERSRDWLAPAAEMSLAPALDPAPAPAISNTIPPISQSQASQPGTPVKNMAPAADFVDEKDEIGLSEQPAPAPDDHNAEDAERMADMARKLDLVLAYQEIGEHVGARVLLEEVIQGGSPLQVEKAKAMLKKLLKEIDWQ